MLSRETLEHNLAVRSPVLQFRWNYSLWRPQWKPGCDWIAEIKNRINQARMAAIVCDDWYAGVTWKFLEKELEYATSN